VQAEDHIITQLCVHIEKVNAVDAGNAAVDFDVVHHDGILQPK
jgi:hypothetical protein